MQNCDIATVGGKMNESQDSSRERIKISAHWTKDLHRKSLRWTLLNGRMHNQLTKPALTAQPTSAK